MTENVVTVSLQETLDRCMALMIEHGFRHLPVLDNNKVVGVLSMPDLVKIIVEQHQIAISQLEARAVNRAS